MESTSRPAASSDVPTRHARLLVLVAGSAWLGLSLGTWIARPRETGRPPGLLLEPAVIDLTGTYRIASGEKNGAAAPQAHIEDTVVEITRDRIVVTDRDQK